MIFGIFRLNLRFLGQILGFLEGILGFLKSLGSFFGVDLGF